MARFKVWYIPQIPGKPFEVERDTAREAFAALDMLGSFSFFEYTNKVKPDYADAGGVSEWNEAEQEWDDIEPEEEVM